MAGELQIQNTTAKTVYSQIRSAVGTIWNGTALEAYLTANILTYDIPMAEQGTASQLYTGPFPATAVPGTYFATYWEQLAGAPAENDLFIDQKVIEWSGFVVLPRAAWALVDVDPVAKARTWIARTDAQLCREIVEVTTSDTAVYSMDFSAPGMLNPGTSLLTADSAIDTSGNLLVISGLTLSQDKKSIHFTVTASDLTADTTYTILAKTTTTDGITIARVGTLRSL